MGPWTTDEIERARKTPFLNILDFLGAYYKRDLTFEPLESGRSSIRLQVGFDGRDFRFILTGEKWVNELRPKGHAGRGGGGAIDFARHVVGCGFVQAVKICLDAQGMQKERKHG